jgi:hypothetical protein
MGIVPLTYQIETTPSGLAGWLHADNAPSAGFGGAYRWVPEKRL